MSDKLVRPTLMLRMRLSKKYTCASDVGFRRTFQPVIYRGMSVFGICRFFKNSQSQKLYSLLAPEVTGLEYD